MRSLVPFLCVLESKRALMSHDRMGTVSQRHLAAARIIELGLHGARHSAVANAEHGAAGVPVGTPAVDLDDIVRALHAAERELANNHATSERNNDRRAAEAGEDRAHWGNRTLGAIQNVFTNMQDGFQRTDQTMTKHQRQTTRMMSAQDENLTLRMRKLNDTLGKAGLLLFGLQLFGLADLGKLIGRPRRAKFKTKDDLEDGGAGLNKREVESLVQKMNKLHMAMHVQNHELNELKKLIKTKHTTA